MHLQKLDNKMQFAIIGVLMLIVLGLYGQFRVLPASEDIGKLNKQLKKDQALLRAPNVPDEPYEDAESLEEKTAEIDAQIEALNDELANVSKSFPEKAQKQDVILKISEAARKAGVRIVQNVPYPVIKRMQTVTDAAGNQKKLSKLSPKERRKLEKKLRKQRKAARKRGAAGQAGRLTYEGELMDKLVNDFEEARPLHTVNLQGGFHQIKQFIQNLNEMPWQITVVKMDLTLSRTQAPKGYPQPLNANLIVGL